MNPNNDGRRKSVMAIAVSSILIIGFAGTAALAFGDDTRMIWQKTRSLTLQKDLANQKLDSGDLIVLHYGAGVDPTQAELDTLNAVTTVPDGRKGLEFFSLAEIQEHAQTVKNNGFGFISYDLEQGASPQSEVDNPVASFQSARAAANAAGIQLMAAPSNAISNGQYADDIARLVHRYHLQSQPRQDDDTTCNAMKNWVTGRISVLEGANPNLAGKITYQVTLTNNPAPGKTIYQTAKDCIDKTSPTTVDGNSIWWGGAQWDNGEYETLLTYHETNYS